MLKTEKNASSMQANKESETLETPVFPTLEFEFPEQNVDDTKSEDIVVVDDEEDNDVIVEEEEPNIHNVVLGSTTDRRFRCKT